MLIYNNPNTLFYLFILISNPVKIKLLILSEMFQYVYLDNTRIIYDVNLDKLCGNYFIWVLQMRLTAQPIQ